MSINENETETEGIKLAELQSGELDDDTLDQLFMDIQRHCKVLGIMVKGGAESYAEGAQPSLTSALKLLREKQIRGVQIRYVFEDVEWWDTLLNGGALVRLLRTKAPTQVATPSADTTTSYSVAQKK